MTTNNDELLALARTIYAEARGEGLIGMDAVAAVVRNRLALADKYVEKHGKPHPLFGDGTISGVVFAPLQFSCWNKNDPNRKKILALTESSGDPLFKMALSVARRAMGENGVDTTGGADHYLTTKAWKDASKTHWCKSKTMIPTATIGNHTFFRQARGKE